MKSVVKNSETKVLPGHGVALTLEHCHALAAHLAHGPCTLHQLAGKADLPLTLLVPRTAELLAIGAVDLIGQSPSGPIYAVRGLDVAAPSVADLAQRQLNTLPVRDQVSIAAGIMAKHGRSRATHRPAAAQLDLAEQPTSDDAPTVATVPLPPSTTELPLRG